MSTLKELISTIADAGVAIQTFRLTLISFQSKPYQSRVNSFLLISLSVSELTVRSETKTKCYERCRVLPPNYKLSPLFLPKVHSMPPSSRMKAADVLADALLEEGLPGHELKAEPVVDHGEASADEAGDAGEAATDILAGICWHVG